MTDNTPREKRWIVLADDGRHSTLGRHTDPSQEEVAKAGDALRAAGMGGWLAMTEGVYYSAGPLSVMMVREIAPPRQSWEAAAAAFLARRTQTLPPFGP
jgi:hypothetical protein